MITKVLETTSTPLGANEEWVSSWYNVEWATHTIFHAESDVAGELFIEQSEDGSTILFRHRASISPNAPITTTVVRGARYVRISYKNGGTAQTRFRATLGAVNLNV